MWPSAFYGRSLAIPALFFCACMLRSFAERDVASCLLFFFAVFARLSGGEERGDERKVLSTTNPTLIQQVLIRSLGSMHRLVLSIIPSRR